METQFDTETTPHQLPDGSWGMTLSDQWNIGENPNGGYLIIPALRAMQGREEHPDPLSVTAHFLRPGTGAAPAQINTEIVRSGRSVTTTRGSLSQNGTARLELIAAFGNLIDRFLNGKVVDFLHFMIGDYDWYIFNIADSSVTIGMILFISHSIIYNEEEIKKQKSL